MENTHGHGRNQGARESFLEGGVLLSPLSGSVSLSQNNSDEKRFKCISLSPQEGV